MGRPVYETPETLEMERRVARILSERWRCSLKKMPLKYELDYLMERNGRGVAFAEIKCRNYTRAQLSKFGGPMISLAKFMKTKQLVRETQLPAYIVIKSSDQLMFLSSHLIDKPVIRWSGRTDRDDNLDQEPYVMLPDELFSTLCDCSSKTNLSESCGCQRSPLDV